VEREKTVLNHTFYDLDSLLLRLSPRKDSSVPLQESTQKWETLTMPERVSFQLDEANVLLLDKAEGSLDGVRWFSNTEILRLDNMLRNCIGLPERGGKVSQPWADTETDQHHKVYLRFRVWAEQEVPGVKIALEQRNTALVTLNGVEAGPVEGWYTDKAILVRSLGDLRAGLNEINITMNISRRKGLEWCYLLGKFGVKVAGEFRSLTQMPELLGFDNVVSQGLPTMVAISLIEFRCLAPGGYGLQYHIMQALR